MKKENLEVLVASTDTSLHKEFSSILYGHKIRSSNIEEASLKTSDKTYKATFVDLDIPGSLEAINEIGNSPIIAVSSNPSQEYIAEEAGAHYFLQRPFKNDHEVRSSIRSACAKYLLNRYKQTKLTT